MEKLQLLFRDLPKDHPVPKEFLSQLENPPAISQLNRERLITNASKTFWIENDYEEKIKISTSNFYDGLFQVENISLTKWGIPGRTGKVISLRDLKDTSKRSAKKSFTRIESFIPTTHALSFHPQIVFANTQNRHKNRLNRMVRHDCNSRVFGSDDRVNIFPNTYPESCICRIEVYTQLTDTSPWNYQEQGTGFMVGKRILMTSGHMRPAQPYKHWKIKVVPAYYDGNSIYGNSFYTYAESYVAYQSDVGNDMMALKLYDDVGDVTGYFGAISYDSDWEGMNVWSLCGYPCDRGTSRPAYQGGISVVDDDDGDDVELPNGDDVDSTQIETYADRANGASGSPLYDWFSNGEMYAIGVHSGEETDWELSGSDTHSVAAGGDMLPAFINWARNEWGN